MWSMQPEQCQHRWCDLYGYYNLDPVSGRKAVLRHPWRRLRGRNFFYLYRTISGEHAERGRFDRQSSLLLLHLDDLSDRARRRWYHRGTGTFDHCTHIALIIIPGSVASIGDARSIPARPSAQYLYQDSLHQHRGSGWITGPPWDSGPRWCQFRTSLLPTPYGTD